MGGYCPGGFCPGGILSGGILSGGDIVLIPTCIVVQRRGSRDHMSGEEILVGQSH